MTIDPFIAGLAIGAVASVGSFGFGFYIGGYGKTAYCRKIARAKETISLEFTGRWIAWSPDERWILAHGDSLREVCDAMERRDVSEPIYQYVPSLKRQV